MFEKKLADDLQAIFNVKKIVYDSPGEAAEQDCLFIEVENSWITVKDKRAMAKVSGSAIMFGQNDKLKFGFFSKAIAQAPKEITKNLFFSDFEENTKRARNLVQRSFSFVYFFDSQYDPETGTITNVTITEE